MTKQSGILAVAFLCTTATTVAFLSFFLDNPFLRADGRLWNDGPLRIINYVQEGWGGGGGGGVLATLVKGGSCLTGFV